MASHANPIERLESLVEDVFRLRWIMAQNEQDNEDSAKYRFNYFVDTPTFRLFAEPGLYSESVAAIPELALDDEFDAAAVNEEGEADDARQPSSAYRNAMFANALLAGEYIFQLASRNGNNPVLVSSDHAAEIFAYITWLEGRSRDGFRRARSNGQDIYAPVRRLLENEGRAFKAGKMDPGDWLARVRQPVVGLISEAAISQMLGPYRLRRLLERQAIANADQALGLTDDIVSPPLRAVSDWRRRIIRAKRGNKVAPTTNALDADAVTLCQLAMLNENRQETGAVHVLITSDRGLHRAYAEWRRDQRAAAPGADVFFAIRDPRQYIPILNVHDMKSTYRASEVFGRVRNSISTFIASFSSTDSNDDSDPDTDPSLSAGASTIRRIVEGRRVRHGVPNDSFEELVRQEIAAIRSHWLEAVELSIAAKADIISELADEEAELWRNAALRGALTANFTSQFTEIQVSFENLASTSTLLRHEIWALGRGRQEFDESPWNHRQLASDFDEFRNPIFAGRSLLDVIADIHVRGEVAVDALKAATTDPDTRKERLLVTGCLSLEIGSWAGAKSVLDRARANKPTTGRLANETIFFHCVARRLAATSNSYSVDYDRVRADLKSLLDRNEKTPRTSEGVRVRNERLALDLCQVAFQAFRQLPYVSQIAGALSHWRRMAEQYEERFTAPARDPFWQTMDKQFTLNSFNLLYWTDASGTMLPTHLIDFVEASLDRITKTETSYLSDRTHGLLYPKLARYSLANDAAQTIIAQDILSEMESILKRDRESGLVFDLPFVDRAEFAAIQRRFNESVP